MLRIPRPGQRTRLLALAYGLGVFIWFSWEDNDVWPVAAFGVGMALLVVSITVLKRLGGKTIGSSVLLPGAILLGVMVGLGGSIATAGLMFFKNALHAHLFLDYPPLLMLAMLERAPFWAVAGGLAGAAIGLLWLAGQRTGSDIKRE